MTYFYRGWQLLSHHSSHTQPHSAVWLEPMSASRLAPCGVGLHDLQQTTRDYTMSNLVSPKQVNISISANSRTHTSEQVKN